MQIGLLHDTIQAMSKAPVTVLFIGLILLGCTPTGLTVDYDDLVSADRIAAHTRFLSLDMLEGRGPATRGETLATEYLATQFDLAGASPAGDNGSYFQTVPLVGVQSLSKTSLVWRSRQGNIGMKWLDDYVVVNHRQRPNELINHEAIFVGHGIVAPEFDWDDYKDADVRDKIVVLFTNEPPSQDPDFFGGKALTYYGRWSFKYEEALRQGASGVIIIHTTPTAGYPWKVVRNSWGGQNPYVQLGDKENALSVAGWVSKTMGETITATTGKTLDQLLSDANSPEFQPIPLNLRIQGEIHSAVNLFETRNVVAKISGSDTERKNEAVLYTAHWDHLGVGVAVDGDNIYNGAVDNASGCGILLELAYAFSQLNSAPERTIIFAAVGAEEGGLRGSQYYAQHPSIAMSKTAVNLNYDGFLPLGRMKDISLSGYERTTLAPLVEELASEFGLTLSPDAYPEQGYYYRSDHFSFAKAGVPAFSVNPGTDYVNRPADWGKEAERHYIAENYHQPSDHFDEKWDFNGLAQITTFGLRLGLRIAATPDLPTWKEGDEFLPARKKSWQ